MVLRLHLPIRQGAIAAAVLACTSGCAVGLVRYSVPPREEAPSPLRGELDRVTVVGAYPAMAAALDRALTDRLGIREVVHAKDGAAASGSTVRVVEDSRASALSTFSLLLSLFSASVIPGYGVEHRRVALTVEAPGRPPRTFEYRYRSSAVVWLPLALVGPDFFGGLNGGWERKEPIERVRREIAELFADEAGPLLAPSPARAGGSE